MMDPKEHYIDNIRDPEYQINEQAHQHNKTHRSRFFLITIRVSATGNGGISGSRERTMLLRMKPRNFQREAVCCQPYNIWMQPIDFIL
jgi:hypothetical protein